MATASFSSSSSFFPSPPSPFQVPISISRNKYLRPHKFGYVYSSAGCPSAARRGRRERERWTVRSSKPSLFFIFGIEGGGVQMGHWHGKNSLSLGEKVLTDRPPTTLPASDFPSDFKEFDCWLIQYFFLVFFSFKMGRRDHFSSSSPPFHSINVARVIHFLLAPFNPSISGEEKKMFLFSSTLSLS